MLDNTTFKGNIDRMKNTVLGSCSRDTSLAFSFFICQSEHFLLDSTRALLSISMIMFRRPTANKLIYPSGEMPDEPDL